MLKLISVSASLCLLVGIGVDRAMRDDVPETVDAYHTLVREATETIPYQVGDWVGVDSEIRLEALRILNANVALSRTYQNVKSGESATLVVVHCGDSRNLLGHYPPVCYPSQGWTQLFSEPKTVTTDTMAVDAREYAFVYNTLSESARLGVLHFTVVPGGGTAPGMERLEDSARSRVTRSYGGASVQFIVDANLPEAQRAAIYGDLVEAAEGWITRVQTGPGV